MGTEQLWSRKGHARIEGLGNREEQGSRNEQASWEGHGAGGRRGTAVMGFEGGGTGGTLQGVCVEEYNRERARAAERGRLEGGGVAN